jgi:hypothetical protein
MAIAVNFLIFFAKHGKEVVDVCWSIEERNFYLQYLCTTFLVVYCGWVFGVDLKISKQHLSETIKIPQNETIQAILQKIKLFQIQNIKFPPLISNVAIGQNLFGCL